MDFDFSLIQLSSFYANDSLFDFLLNLSVLVWVLVFSNKMPVEKESVNSASARNIISLDNYELTKRETEIVELVYCGKTNQEIADELFISLKTVKAHIYNIFKKTGSKNRTQLANLISGK